MDINQITQDYFYSERCCKRFLLAVKYVDKINEYFEKGYIVFDEYDRRMEDKFQTELYKQLPDKDKSPIIEKDDIVYYGSSFVNGKVYMEDTLKDIRKRFMKFKIFDPNNFIKLGKI